LDSQDKSQFPFLKTVIATRVILARRLPDIRQDDPMDQKDDLLADTQQKFKALADTDLSPEQARVCIANVSGFLAVLVGWAESELDNTRRRHGHVPRAI